MMKMGLQGRMQLYAVAGWSPDPSLMCHPHSLVRVGQIELEEGGGGLSRRYAYSPFSISFEFFVASM